MFVVDALKGLLRPSGCLACGVPAAWPCCADCLPSEPGAVGPWVLAADPDLPLWTLGPYRDGLRTAVLNNTEVAIGDIGNRLAIDPTGRSFVVSARSTNGASLWMINRQDKSVSYLTLPNPNDFDSDPSFASR